MGSNLHTAPLDRHISAIKVQPRFDESLTTDSPNQRFLFPSQVFPNGDQVKSKPSGKTKNQNNQNALKLPPLLPHRSHLLPPPPPVNLLSNHIRSRIPNPIRTFRGEPYRTTKLFLSSPRAVSLFWLPGGLCRSRFRWFRVGWERLSDGCVCCVDGGGGGWGMGGLGVGSWGDGGTGEEGEGAIEGEGKGVVK